MHLGQGLAHGDVRSALPPGKLEAFLLAEERRVLRDRARSSTGKTTSRGARASGGATPMARAKWYTRYAMWWEAVKLRSTIVPLNELSEAEYSACLDAVHKYYAYHPNVRETHGVEKGKGPVEFAERDQPCAQYNGTGGGRMLKWYQRGVFQAELRRLGTTMDSASERQWMLALRSTSASLAPYSIVTR